MNHGCGSQGGAGTCGCASNAATMPEITARPVAHVNGIALHAQGEQPDEETLRQRACTELLRQAAQRKGLLAQDDLASADGATSQAATQAIESLLEQELEVLEPSEEACRRYYEANDTQHRQGERVRVRHVLYAVTPGVDVQALRGRAEALLLSLRCAEDGGVKFAAAAREWSNCPSGQQGGELGWLARGDCAEEFARELFGSAEIGVLSRLVHSRFGLHVVEVLERESGHLPPFELVQGAVALTLRQRAWVNALRQYLPLLASEAVIEGVQLEGSDSPLVQ
ncbi:peptidylprolyl isomerase [Ottowia thiooxydans]|uniref:peptidylprolyl isomerase n=1 Tax=Ottowia thiooxydans TaxID=219182 RepID=UPI0003F88593|nr:peptidylprolyl isomerase [Ottowia thiooxydans]